MTTLDNSNETNPDVVREQLKDYKSEEIVNYTSPDMDAFDKLIYVQGIRIKAVHIHKDLDLLLVVLNNQQVINRSLSACASLKQAKPDQLRNFEIIGGGSGIHWPEMDEDLSLKGFLNQELTSSGSFMEKK